MSLTEALLLDPYPFEVWIAARTDGVKGSGTQADPYDGSTIKSSAVDVSLTRSGLAATAATSNAHGSGQWIATAQIGIYSAHGLEKGDIVQITNAGSASFASTSLYTNNFKVTAVPSATEFEFYLSADPGADSSSAADFAPGYWGRIWDLGWWLLEGNVIELSNRTLNTDFNRAVGIVAYLGNFGPQNTLRQAVIRDNVIRQFQNRSDPSTLIYSHAMELFGNPDSGIDAGLLQKNVATLDNVVNVSTSSIPAPIEQVNVTVVTFDNRSSTAVLIPAALRVVFNPPATELISQIVAQLDDAQAVAFLS